MEQGNRARRQRRRPQPGWADALRRTPVSMWRDDIDHWAAALTYYSVLAIFPALLVALSVAGFAHPDAASQLISQVTALVPGESRAEVRATLRDLADQRSAAWVLVVVASVSALVSAYNYLSVFRRVLLGMHGRIDRRPPWRTVPRTLLTALGLLALLVACATVLILTGAAVRSTGRMLGTGEASATAWNIMKWPLLVLLVAGLVLTLFRTGPTGPRVPHRGIPGGALAVLLWLVASAAFALYASEVSTYNRLYGSLAGIVVFLVWLWVSNLALLAGAQFNAELAKVSPSPKQARHARALTETAPVPVIGRHGPAPAPPRRRSRKALAGPAPTSPPSPGAPGHPPVPGHPSAPGHPPVPGPTRRGG